MKRALESGGVEGQGLLIPEIVELDEDDRARLLEHAEDFARLGLVIDGFGPGAVAVREVPALFGDGDVKGLVRDLADELAEHERTFSLEGAAVRDLRDHGVSWKRARRAAAQARGDERAAARDGGDAAFRAVQSRAADLCRAEAGGYREAVRAAVRHKVDVEERRAWAGSALMGGHPDRLTPRFLEI